MTSTIRYKRIGVMRMSDENIIEILHFPSDTLKTEDDKLYCTFTLIKSCT